MSRSTRKVVALRSPGMCCECRGGNDDANDDAEHEDDDAEE